MMILIRVSLLLLAATFSPLTLCATKVIQPDPSFQMAVVDGWKLIDAESMSIFNKVKGRSGHQYYDIGIRRVKSKHEFDYPYLLVQIKNDGVHPTINELNRIPKVNVLEALTKINTEKLNKNKMYFDEINNAGFAVIDTKDAAGVAVGGFSISYLTSDGYVLVACYYKKSQMTKYIKDLTYMATSILINSGHKYGVKEVYVDPYVEEQNKKTTQTKNSKYESQSQTVSALNKGVPAAAFTAIVLIIGYIVKRIIMAIKKKPE